MKRKIILICLSGFLLFYLGTILYQAWKPLPKGISYEGNRYKVEAKDISFLTDLTYQEHSKVKKEQSIFPRVMEMIDEAKSFIILDLFLFNGYYNDGLDFPKVSEKLVDKLIDKKKKNPSMTIIVITDEINTSYGSYKLEGFERLKRNGIQVVMTNVDKLRDSTPLYSGIWRMFLQWFDQSGHGWLPNLLADNAPRMTIRSYLKLLNIKANHRKTIVTDKTAMILSGNPSHDASANFNNSAFEVRGGIIHDVLQSEQAAIRLSNRLKVPKYQPAVRRKGDHQVQLLTEGKVYKHVLEQIEQTQQDDQIWMAMFYIADREIIHALIKAAKRGVKIQLILDPTENAFGHKKHGLPNHPVAYELVNKSKGRIQIRWYKAMKEQFHPKLIYIKKKQKSIIFNGSTNLTYRNLADYNLETDILIVTPNGSEVSEQVNEYFQRLWKNENGEFTASYHKEKMKWIYFKRGVYRLQELLQLTTY